MLCSIPLLPRRLSKRSPPHSKRSCTTSTARAFFRAIAEGRCRAMLDLMDRGCTAQLKHPDVVQGHGGNCLLYCLMFSPESVRTSILAFLMRRGADFQQVDPDTGRDVLAWGCFLGATQESLLMLDHCGGDVDYRRTDHDGRNYLHLAVLGGDMQIVRILVDNMLKVGLSVDEVDGSRDKMTAYLMAHRLGHSKIAMLLVEKGGAAVNQFDTQTFRDWRKWVDFGSSERELLAQKMKKEENIRRKIEGRVTSNKKLRDISDWLPRTEEFKEPRCCDILSDRFDEDLHLSPVYSRETTTTPWSEPHTRISSATSVSCMLNLWSEQKTSAWRKSRKPQKYNENAPSCDIYEQLRILKQVASNNTTKFGDLKPNARKDKKVSAVSRKSIAHSQNN